MLAFLVQPSTNSAKIIPQKPETNNVTRQGALLGIFSKQASLKQQAMLQN